MILNLMYLQEDTDMKTTVIDVGKEFSVLPQGRYYSDSPNSAEAFFVHVLEDWLSDGYSVELDFSNTLQVGSCFLQQLAYITVNNYYTNHIKVYKDDKYEWVIVRWDKCMEEALNEFNSK